MNHDRVKLEISDYYSNKIRLHGSQHEGVDWNSQESQWLRFEQLLRGFSVDGPFSVNDYGCGYGALIDYLNERHLNYQYNGYDLSDAMINAATDRYTSKPGVVFTRSDDMAPADYTIASGILNVRLSQPDDTWEDYIRDCLAKMDRASRKGFSFNMLTTYSDPPRRRDDLYYGDPTLWFDYCKRHFSRNVALFHDYNLYEFTISVNKTWKD